MKWYFGLVMIGIWITAVYSGHHYVVDCIMGIICALTGIFIFQSVLLKASFVRNFLSNYEQAISDNNSYLLSEVKITDR